MRSDSVIGSGSIVLGPGERLSRLAAVLGALGSAQIARADDIELLAEHAGESGLLVLDAGAIAAEDLGYARRFLDRRPQFRALVVGDDPATRVARALLARPGTSWLAWPPDLDEVSALAGPPATKSGSVESPPRRAVTELAAGARSASGEASTESARPSVGAERANAERDESMDASRDEIAEIQAILEGQALASDRTPSAGTPSAEDPRAGRTDTTSIDASPTQGTVDELRARMPRWWRDQVADLADATQRIELGAQVVRAAAGDLDPDVAQGLDTLDGEVARLVQFARTLACLAAPPARGDQTFDLAEMLQLFVAQLASRGPDSPRCQLRASGKTFVRSDRALLGTAFDAFFYLAQACSSRGELVRAQVRRAERLGAPIAEVRLEFPAGPLAGTDIARVLEPYGVKRVLPLLGPNALAAAIAIVEGQGGSAALGTNGDGRLEWRVELPATTG